MINFFKKEYKERLNEVKKDDFIDKFIIVNEDEETVDLNVNALIEAVFQKGWEAYRAAVLEASYLDK